MYRTVIALLFVSWIGEASDLAAATSRRRSVRHPGPAMEMPVAAADHYSLTETGTLTIAAPGVLANDTLNGAAIASFGPSTGTEQTVLGTAAQTVQGGSLSLSADGGFTYTPPNAFTGTDTFRYVIGNAGGSSPAAVTIVVSGLDTAAVDDAYSTAPEFPLSVPAPGLLTNDTLAGGRIASFGAFTGAEQTSVPGSSRTAQGGTLTLAQDGSFSYTPPPTEDDGYGYPRQFLGVDTFRYILQRDAVLSAAPVRIAVEFPAEGADYVVTTPGHYYAVSDVAGQNPVLQLTRGRTYKFRINAPGHPFAILDAPPGSVTNNNITQGVVTFAVPLTSQTFRYRCTTHGFGSAIETVP